jgi:hypothetical protein
VRSLLLKALPKLEDIDIARLQRGDESHGVQIPGMDAANDRHGTHITTGSSKGKGKAMPYVGSGDEVLSVEDIPLQRRRRLLRSDGPVVGGSPLSGEQVPKMATMP